MPTEPHAPIRGRQLAALRTCVLYPQGLRYKAYPSAMLVLRKRGFVVSGLAHGPGRKIPAWFITQDGRDHLAEIDALKPSVPRSAGTGSR